MSSTPYFAFGSNMLSARLQARTDSARPRGLAELPGWRLAFHKRGADSSGKGDIVPGANSDRVLGVVFEIDHAQLDTLDGFEGAGYARTTVDVRHGGTSVRCICYRATADYIDRALKPYDWYRRLVLAGLLEHGADERYVEQIRVTPWLADPDPERPARQLALAALATFTARHPGHAESLSD